MTRKSRRMYVLVVAIALLASATALVLTALDDNITYFYSPSDLKTKQVTIGRAIRLGGLVEDGTFEKLGDGLKVKFSITDGAETVAVTYQGILPDLFREGQGVITEGSLNEKGEFIAHEVLAKHDENYMPTEVIEALKASGEWRGDEEQVTE
ncbi:cytochrome C biogenesis protein CcmE [Kiloniella spongiae]|uniref:Cytochrome c-type biogenesis protein CcmE n=1 Tax=Kiloniella spongiae TaxID=1489064 RepID=A0A0H2MDM7_9PROT|nr:cytochrome c maturation protein CcmE [Kiloniella spongiae]KLN60639.1 cytochrome C biogenesis protein CcmE [Kiloniella spongiae]